MVTGFKGYIEGAVVSLITSIPEGMHFCMGSAGHLVVALAHHLAIPDHHCSDTWIR
jgi:hypothetical protein